jgi:hypothetical protein
MFDFSIDTSDPTSQGGPVSGPNSVRRKQALADALMKQGMDTSPAAGGRYGGVLTALNRGLAGALGGYQVGQADREERAGYADAGRQFASGPTIGGFMPMGTAETIGKRHPATLGGDTTGNALAADTSSKIYNNDEPSPLDPPSGDDRRKMLATILGEENTPQGQSGVANVIRNRAVDGSYGGDTPSAVVQSPNQFEPWNTPAGRARMAAALQNPDQVAAADAAIRGAYGEGGKAPNDPTEGKTMFYAPAAQAALGRPPPSWAQGEGQQLGKTMFYDDNSGTPQNAQPAQGQLPVGPQVAQNGGGGADVRAWAMGIINNPYSNPAQKQVAAAALQKVMTPKEDSWSSAGSGYIMNSRTGEIKKGYEPEEKPPASVQEYEYYKKGFQPSVPGEQPMPYQTWSVQKARAGATNISNVGNVGAENKGLGEAAKLDAEAVRKGQNEQMPALDDADRNFQIMQDAIDRNGGKLPTGGVLGKLGLDARRTAGYIRDNWGIDLGDDPTTATSLETFNKGGIKASGDMAKAIGGTRVLKVEFDMAQKANPGLETTDGGNKYLIDLNRNTIAIKRDHLQAQEDYWRDHNHSLDGFQKSWNAEVKSTPRPLSNFSVVPPINNGDGSQFVKLPSTGQGGYTWYRKGQDGLSPVTDQNATSRLEDSAKPLKADKPAPVEKVFNGKAYIKQDGNWFEKPAGAP